MQREQGSAVPHIAHIQSTEDGLPYSVHGAAAARGFAFLGRDVRLFRPDELPGLPLTRADVVVAGMGTFRAALERLGVPPPTHAGAPAVLGPYLGRESARTTLRDLRDSGRFPVFVKPYEDAKVFTGRVVRAPAELDALLGSRPGFPTVDDEFPLLAQEPVDFRSEWRVFVRHGTVLGVSHYAGDPLLFPAPGVIRLALGAYRGAPAGYAADFGVSADGRTLLVETNDGYALGHGGLAPNLYAQLLQSRWDELMQTARQD